MLKRLEQTVEWLFEKAPEGWYGQLAFGRPDKTATLWLPGTKRAETVDRLIRTAAIGGATQRAYLSPTEPMRDQSCWICWVGLDVDDLAPVQKTMDGLADVLAILDGSWSMRRSHSGNGIHLIARLAKPIFCHHSQSNAVVKQITAPHIAKFEAAGVHVCKGDCRVFWLEGGKQMWFHQSDDWLTPQIVAPTSAAEAAKQRPVVDLSALKPGIAVWARRFIDAGVIRSIQKGQSCYLRDAIEVIRAAGETAPTRSSLRAKSGGFIDIGSDRIQLWAHADGGVIWSYEEPDL